MLTAQSSQLLVIGAGVGGLTTAAVLAQAGYAVTVLEAGSYPGGSAGTFYHQGYRFDAGATLAGGFQSNGPHMRLAHQLEITWPVHPTTTAWTVHLPDRQITLDQTNRSVLDHFPESASFWAEQTRIADAIWMLTAQELPWPPTDTTELIHLLRVGMANFPTNLQLIPFAFRTARQWAHRHNLTENRAFMRFMDAQLLISAQTTSVHANALYSATALDLPRQGVMQVVGGIGNLAHTLADKITALGGTMRYKQRVTRIAVKNGRAVGVHTEHPRQGTDYIPSDFVIANMTPWSLDYLLGVDSSPRLRHEIQHRAPGWGAFVLYLGVDEQHLPQNLHGHHQIITTYDGPLGEGRSIFVSFSPRWDTSRAPNGHRAVTISTHTAIQPWWDLLESDFEAYEARKHAYTERILAAVEQIIPGLRRSSVLCMPGTPVTYQNWTHRHRGMVGGFPQQSLWQARGPRTGIPNLLLVGDSIFPGQSTAGVTVGALRVARMIQRRLPHPQRRSVTSMQPSG